MRILVTGGHGQVGRELDRLARGPGATGATSLWAPGRSELDVTRPHEVLAALLDFRPSAVIHAAALTDVDRCEREVELAHQVNAEATAELARVCARHRIPLVYVSTDYVFDGAKGRPYVEGDTPRPLSVYARTKWQGEQAVSAAGGPHAIVRTAWVYSIFGRNFAVAILEAARRSAEEGSGEPLRVVADQVGSPTYARDLATALLRMVEMDLASSRRLFHAANAGACSRWEQARALVALAGWEVPVLPVSTGEMPRPARRPAYSALDSGALAGEGIAMRPWGEALEAFVRELAEARPDLVRRP
ncbi:dTDP-4-dehydrorhamnose reductase [Carboxydochorda subterranea]|uniref:dTDP-4-dehydrorhamnose reductase n=1 Tax=Carboxydichorda subterranea TaxID=3109565 RepID=A0ABZ1BXJ3_9FIRM|nr:dTDP-4-dehydrorhamnose reductase [Limnochorda sp. L945t]WRP17266.1 dTDP-4-dehydrorhamnose reductase [Limnochorda sp. L945t]